MKSSHLLPLYLVPTTALLLTITNRAMANVEYSDVNANLDEAFGFKLAAESRHGSIYSDRVVERRRRRRRLKKRRSPNSSSQNESKDDEDEDGEPIEIIAERTKSILHGAALHLSTFGERAVDDDAGGLVETLGGGKNEWPPTENEMKQSDDRHYKRHEEVNDEAEQHYSKSDGSKDAAVASDIVDRGEDDDVMAVRRPHRGGVYGLIATIAVITTMKKKMKEGSNKSNFLAVRHPNAVPNHPSKKERSFQIVTRLHLLLLPLLR